MAIKDRRCSICNWLNREVSESFVCKNCNKSNGATREEANIEVPRKIKSDSIK